MIGSKSVQYGMLGIIALIASVKIHDKCSYCAYALIVAGVILFIAALLWQIKKKKKINKIKDKY
jgi:Ca2+/Na+ antiporter